MVRGFERLGRILRIVLDDELERSQHRHRPPGRTLEIGSNARLEPLELHRTVFFGHPGPFAEIAQRLRGKPAPPHSRDGGHARVVPSIDMSAVHQTGEIALAHDGVRQIQPAELDLAWRRLNFERLEEPFVEWAMIFELERAQRVGDSFNRVR